MKVLGIGNAIVDVICRVDDSFLIKNGLTKSTMKLIDENEFKKLSLNLKIENGFLFRISKFKNLLFGLINTVSGPFCLLGFLFLEIP